MSQNYYDVTCHPHKRVLILTVLAGMGHIKAAEALYNKFKESYGDIEVFLADPLEKNYKSLRNFINFSYTYTAHYLPLLWKFTYNSRLLSSKYSLYYFLLRVYKKEILKLYQEYLPDTIVCLHPFATSAAAELKKKNKIKAKIICIATDYDLHHLSISNYVDKFIVAIENTKDKLTSKNIKEEKIKIIGIPVDIKKHCPTQRIIINDNIKNKVLISLGGYNIGPIYRIVKELINIDDIYFIVIAGRNKKLYKKIKSLTANRGNFCVLEYVEGLSSLMKQVDLYIAKPGGLSISEAINIKVGLLLLKPLPQEEINFHYLVEKKAALPIYNINKIKEEVLACFKEDKRLIYQMKKNQAKIQSNICVRDSIIKEIINN